MGIYLLNLLAVFRLYYKSNKTPFVLGFLCFTGYRIHSIFVLRLSNDPVAMFFFYLAANFLSQSYQFRVTTVALRMSAIQFRHVHQDERASLCSGFVLHFTIERCYLADHPQPDVLCDSADVMFCLSIVTAACSAVLHTLSFNELASSYILSGEGTSLPERLTATYLYFGYPQSDITIRWWLDLAENAREKLFPVLSEKRVLWSGNARIAIGRALEDLWRYHFDPDRAMLLPSKKKRVMVEGSTVTKEDVVIQKTETVEDEVEVVED